MHVVGREMRRVTEEMKSLTFVRGEFTDVISLHKRGRERKRKGGRNTCTKGRKEGRKEGANEARKEDTTRIVRVHVGVEKG